MLQCPSRAHRFVSDTKSVLGKGRACCNFLLCAAAGSVVELSPQPSIGDASQLAAEAVVVGAAEEVRLALLQPCGGLLRCSAAGTGYLT
jgi:hypothetical protein